MNAVGIKNLDIDLLHKVVNAMPEDPFSITNEKIGKTTAVIALAAGEIELGDQDNEYLVVSQTNNQMLRVISRFERMAQRLGNVFYTNDPDVLMVNTQRWHFYALDSLDPLPRAVFDRVFTDLAIPERKLSRHQRITISKIRMSVKDE